MTAPPNAAEVIRQVETADISVADWSYGIIESLPDYWRGFFNCLEGEIANGLSSASEEYREELVYQMQCCWEER